MTSSSRSGVAAAAAVVTPVSPPLSAGGWPGSTRLPQAGGSENAQRPDRVADAIADAGERLRELLRGRR